MSDLVFIEDGNPNVTSSGLINFGKRRQIGSVIRWIQKYQKVPFFFDTVQKIQDWLNNIENKEEKELHTLSLQYEPQTTTK